MRNLIILSCLIIFAGGALSACNTVEGLGKDVEKAGEKIQKI